MDGQGLKYIDIILSGLGYHVILSHIQNTTLIIMHDLSVFAENLKIAGPTIGANYCQLVIILYILHLIKT